MEENKKLVIKDGTALKIKDFNTEENKLSVTLLDMGYQQAVDTLTEEQISDVKVLNELGETVLSLHGYILGNSISVNTEDNTTKVTFESKEMREALVDVKKAIQALQNISVQNKTDIDAINGAIASLAEIVGGTTE